MSGVMVVAPSAIARGLLNLSAWVAVHGKPCRSSPRLAETTSTYDPRSRKSMPRLK